MRKGDRTQYAVAGVQGTPGIRMNVRSNVRLPDSEAGGYDAPLQQPFYAGRTAPPPRRSLTVTGRNALVFLCALTVLFGALVLTRYSRVSQLRNDRGAIESSIQAAELDIKQKQMEVKVARDAANICYAATQRLGMISSNAVEPVLVVALSTRPYANEADADVSPYSALEGTIIGSR